MNDAAGRWPVTLVRPLADRVLGAVVYALATPLIALGSGLLAGPLVAAALIALLGDERQAGAAGLVVVVLCAGSAGLAAMGFVARAGWRAYRAGAGRELRLWPDRLERIGRRVEVWSWEEVDRLLLLHTSDQLDRVVLRLRGGGEVSLRRGHWDIDVIRTALERALVPALAERYRAALRQGEAVAFREPLGFAAASLVLGALSGAWGALILGLVALNALERGGPGPGDLHPVVAGALLMAAGLAGVKLGVSFQGGGMTLSPTGVRRGPEPSPDEVPWATARAIDRGARLEVTSDRGDLPVRLSRSGESHAVLVRLLPELIAARGP
ncbi:MAG: hypothetical protein M9894_02855 [Planctomycetes bacterium]|nr:hypothetical protein [Planctomycetota bacterium]